ncbi:PIG-L family deacetylase [Bacillus sp. ISL-37]|uniref:PIG-L family deacetylase n=1 Tax=Bacillus sp. ISL-37 TaxID=2819123 RepID=UPI001BE9001A|nr:PIG-L family deacetylase [Bacillus sp. ISL-37]MBT2685996.1 PIG-L family deacetylase [Bacillus sp. ISL-37]
MKKIIAVAVLSIVIIVGFAIHTRENFDTVIFYSPHADDEVLSMGPSILHYKNKEKKVVVVLLSEGLASAAYPKLNNKLNDSGLPLISKKQFGEARQKEFKLSLEKLGISSSDIYFYNLPDGKFSKDDVSKIMQEMNTRYPNAQHHAMSYKDPHHDHATTGQALQELLEQDKINNGIFHLPIQEYANIEYDRKQKVPSNKENSYKDALDAYGIWKPEDGYYSIGLDSVTDYFRMAREEMESRWHK